MKTNKLLKFSSFALIAMLAAAFSCNDEERISLQDTQDITEETEVDKDYQDWDDMGNRAFVTPTDAQYNNGRAGSTVTFTIADDSRFCNGTLITLNSTGNATTPQGTITIDFGTSGCTDNKGNVRKGKLIFTYNGRRFYPGSTIVTTGDNYSINGVKLEGTRTLTNVQANVSSAPRFNVVLSNGKATFENGAVAERNSNITWEWIRATNPLDDQLKIEANSEANGKTRAGRTYSMNVLETLIFKRTCGMAVDGIKKYVIGGSKDVIIDYGNGDCDKSITVTVNGITRNITMK